MFSRRACVITGWLKTKAAGRPDPTGYGNEPNTVPGENHSDGPAFRGGWLEYRSARTAKR